MTLQPGSRIGQYEIRALLGIGGMGEVYRAHDSRLGRDVALKTLPAALVADAERLARFEREARILATINHPNVATIYGFESDAGVSALVMELVEGETLEDRLLRAPPNTGLTLPTVLHIAGQIVAALDAAHEKGIVHRDLKPANIKLTADDAVKVLDFGIAKPLEHAAFPSGSPTKTSASPALTEVGVVLGTAAYMSPEQARGQAVDRRTDIWAFGCIVYEMLTGRAAFAADTASDTIAAVLRADLDLAALPADVPPSLRALVARCLERNLKARLRDIADARLYLEDGAAAAAPIAASKARRGLSRRAALVGGAALAVIGAAVGGGSALWTRGGPGTKAEPVFQRLTFRRGMIRTARFGPDFQTVFYGALWDGDVCRVYTVRPDSPESTALPLPPAAPHAVSSSGELALALGTHRRGIMTYGTLARVPLVGGAPRELEENIKYADWSRDGSTLAIVRRVGDHERLEFPAGTVIAEPELPGGGFSFPRVSPRGDAVALFELNAPDNLVGRVVIVDRGGTRRVTSALYFNVFGLAWKGDEVWFTAAEEVPLLRNAVLAMNATGDIRIVARAPGNTTLHDVAPDGRVLIARTDDRGGIAVRALGEATERDMSWLDESLLADISPDGRQILYTEVGVGGGPRLSTYLRGTDGSLAVRLGDGLALALSRDGRRALVLTDLAQRNYLEVIPTGAGQARRLERPGLKMWRARWLPDNRNAVVLAEAADAPRRLYVLDVDGTATQAVTPEGLSVGTGGWAVSPDGAMVAVSTEQGVKLFPLGGGPERLVPASSARSTVVGWIEPGLLISEDPLAGGVVQRVDPATGRRDTWADIQPQDAAGIMSLDLNGLVAMPDGRSYGYSWHRAISDLYIVDGWS